MSDQIRPWPLLRRGSQGHPVPAPQYLLRARGHTVTVDGIFGPKTEAAVENFQAADRITVAVRGFQQALGITVDGIVGPVTWRALVSGMLAG